jgi:hypothetical protein
MAELVSPKLPVWQLGEFAKDAIGRKASQCTVYSWLIPHFEVWRPFLPQHQSALEKLTPELAGPNWDTFETYVLGGLTKEMLELGYAMAERGGAPDERQVADAMAKGLSVGAKAFTVDLKASQRQTEVMLRSIAGVADLAFDAKRFLD